jgi:hypothetical protein
VLKKAIIATAAVTVALLASSGAALASAPTGHIAKADGAPAPSGPLGPVLGGAKPPVGGQLPAGL